MKAAFVTQLFPPETAAGAHRAGALAAALSTEFELEVLTLLPSYPHPSAYSDSTVEFAFCVTRFGHFAPHASRLTARAIGEIAMAWRITRAAYALRPGVIIATSPSMFLGPFGLLVARLARARFVWDIRDLTWEYAREQAERWPSRGLARATAQLMWTCARRSDLVFAATAGIAEGLYAAGVRPQVIRVVPNCPSADVVTAVSAPTRAVGQQPRVLYAGVIGRNQGLDVLIDVALRRPEIRFVLAGDGPERVRLERLVAARGVHNVELVGFVDRLELTSLYEDADVLFAQVRDTPVLSRDSLPSKLFEYMAAQRPIVYAGHGATAARLRDAGAAVVVPAGDAAAIGTAIDCLLGDPDQAEELVRRAQEHLRQGPTREEVMASAARMIAVMAGGSA